MILMINGKEATKGMEVTTFRGETYILDGWRAPNEINGGMNGKVYCKTKEDYENNSLYCHEWYPSVIGAQFVEKQQKKDLAEQVKDAEKKVAAHCAQDKVLNLETAKTDLGRE